MASDTEPGNECTPLLSQPRLSQLQHEQDEEASSIVSSTVTKEERRLADSTVGERLPYNDYTTIDWLHDLVKDSYRFRYIQSRRGIRYKILSYLDACSGWIAVVIIGALTACVAFVVDIAVATMSDWKIGYCSGHVFRNREVCCAPSEQRAYSSLSSPLSPPLWFRIAAEPEVGRCADWHPWSEDYTWSFAIYVAIALIFGVLSSSITMLTKTTLPSASTPDTSPSPSPLVKPTTQTAPPTPPSQGKILYPTSGSGIPELKTLLSGFTIPPLLSTPVLVTKSLGAVFAVSANLCLGKEGPFVHISACLGYLTGRLLPKYASNGRKMRELLSASCSAGLSVAFGAPIGGVLFSYEEVSTFFPRNVLWRAFLCSLTAAMVLRELNPTGTGKLVLFESQFGEDGYEVVHYFVFVALGVAGGVFGGLFCKANFLWAKWFRAFAVIKHHPVLEVAVVVLVTALVQFPNPLIRDMGDVVVKRLLVDCGDETTRGEWVCKNEQLQQQSTGTVNWKYVGWLAHGTLAKLVLTIITFGIKVPSGVIIPALDAGALFGRLVGQLIGSISPGIFAMVGAAAFLAGVSRMTISLAVIMFELTGQLSYTVPSMLAILIAKWVADAISTDGVYDIAQTLLSHPFLDPDAAIAVARRHNACVQVLVPPKRTMDEISVHVPPSNKVNIDVLRSKLNTLKRRGLMDAGLVLVQSQGAPDRECIPVLQGYISQAELEFGLGKLVVPTTTMVPGQDEIQVRLLGHQIENGGASPQGLELDLTPFVDRTPLTVCAKAPLEYAVEMFSKLGLRYLMVTEQGTGQLVGVIIKKRLVAYLEQLREHGQGDE